MAEPAQFDKRNLTKSAYQIGQTVQIVGRNLVGRIAYVGSTNFANGLWIGVVLNSNQGKNNGTIRGRVYFKCAPNYGIFVRATQLKLIDTANTKEPQTQVAKELIESSKAPTQQRFIQQQLLQAMAKALSKEDLATIASSISPPPPTPQPTTQPLPKQPTQHLLKTTKIHKPRLITSSSQLALNTVASINLLGLQPPLSQAHNATPQQHALPKRSKTSVSPTDTVCCSKRASFVETGFLEILQPQFTPGQALRSPSTANIATRSAQEQTHSQEPTQPNNTAELATLRQQLKDSEKVRLQNEQLLEFKSQIMEKHHQLQCELQRYRHELRTAHELNTKYRNELDELADSMELLALDKEMADERAETMQMELELLQERNEELTLDVEILRAEHESRSLSLGCNAEQLASFQSACDLKRLEQYNQRLRETVIRLRDALTSDKQELQRANKELETKQSEIAELKQTKETLSKRVDLLETHIIDLKEQVDAALGAEQMVATLADVKLELEERVKLLEEEVTELEALEEIHEQLIESNQELEHDLREEIEALHMQQRSLQQQKDAAMESVYERDVTIMKFRELVRTLNEQIREGVAVAGLTSACEDFSSTGSACEETQSLDYQHLFTATKAYGRAIDQQLNAIALRLKSQHIEQLLAFVPEKILLRGGEHDVILVLLLLQSTASKVEILTHGIMEKFPATCEFDRDTIFEGYSVQRSAFRSKSLFMLRSLQMLLQQLLYMLQHGDYEYCTHVAIYRSELEAQEQRLDELLRQLKAGLLDEHTPCDSFERVLGFFNMLYSNLLAPKLVAELVDEQQLHSAFLEVLDAAVDSININACLLHTLIQVDNDDCSEVEQSDSFVCTQLLSESLAQLKQELRKLQRRFTAAGSMAFVTFSGMQWERMQHILATIDICGRVINILTATTADTSKELSAAKTQHPDSEVSIEHAKLWRILTLHYAKLAPEHAQQPSELFQHCIDLLGEELGHYASYLQTHESDKCLNLNTVYVRAKAQNTLMQRAAQVKQHYQDIKALELLLAEREKELKTQKFIAKMKQNDYSELQIRKEMADKQLNKQQSEHEQLLLLMAEQLAAMQQHILEHEMQVSAAMDKLLARLEQLSADAVRCQQQCSDKRLKANTSSDETQKQLECMQMLLRHQRHLVTTQQAKYMKACLHDMESIHVPRTGKATDTANEIQQLERHLQQLKREWLLTYIRLRPSAAMQRERLQLQTKCEQLAKRIAELYLQAHPYQAKNTACGVFPKPQYRALLLGK